MNIYIWPTWLGLNCVIMKHFVVKLIERLSLLDSSWLRLDRVHKGVIGYYITILSKFKAKSSEKISQVPFIRRDAFKLKLKFLIIIYESLTNHN